MGWWFFTRSAIEALTRPSADVDACDRAAEELARGSLIGGAVHHASTVMRDAWADSRARAAVISIARDLTPAPAASALRVRGWIAAVSGATILGLDAVKPVPVGPLAWLLPSLALAAGLLTMLMAAPLARAADHRRDGDKVISR